MGQGPDALVIVDRLKLVNPDISDLEKRADGLIYSKSEANDTDASVRVRSGFLESSNVNAVGELTTIMSLADNLKCKLR